MSVLMWFLEESVAERCAPPPIFKIKKKNNFKGGWKILQSCTRLVHNFGTIFFFELRKEGVATLTSKKKRFEK